MSQSEVTKYLAEIGRRGGSKSKRKLTKKDAREMALKRWGKKKEAK